MNDFLFSTLWAECFEYEEKPGFVSDWALSSVWGDDPEAEVPAERIKMLGRLWDAAHLSIRDIRTHTGLSQSDFGRRFLIPKHTIENWESGRRQCPDYLRLLLAEATGLYHRPSKSGWAVTRSGED